MMSGEEKAMQYKHAGSNCCQAVMLAFADRMGMTEDQLRRLGSGFGAGMGGMKGTCGALVGAVAAANMMNQGAPAGRTARAIVDEFEKMCGSTICGDIKGVKTGRILCACDDCVRNAARILDRYFPVQ